MSNKKFDVVVFIARLQPLHNSHLAVIKKALFQADKVLVLIGSSHQPRTAKNPFIFQERADMVNFGLSIDEQKRIACVPLEDNLYNDQAWVTEVQQEVEKISAGKVGIIGHIKDDSSYYIKMFPQWDFIDCGYMEVLHSTEIRDMYFAPGVNLNYLVGVVPNNVLTFLNEFKKTEDYQQIVREKDFIAKYKQQFANLPYPPIFVTTDAVVIQSGHVLMIRRRSEPGKGLLALPGGFLDARGDKSMEDGMIRELFEETGIKVPEKVLRGNIKQVKVFDAVDRSVRGRTITHAFKIVLSEGEWALPKLRAGDDAEKAIWVPIGQIKKEECFEDHHSILMYFLGR